MLEIRSDDLSGEPTRALLSLHLLGMNETSPPGHVFALDLSGLQGPGVTVWSAWIDGHLAAIGALKMLSESEAEIKSMRTHPDYLRRGAARALLQHIIQQARLRNVRRLSLETGRGPSFEPALTLYRSHGFENGAPFGDYRASDFNQFLHLAL